MERCIDFKDNVLKECPPNICKIIDNQCTVLPKYSLDEEKQLIKLFKQTKKFILN